jgi:hypothetical protein
MDARQSRSVWSARGFSTAFGRGEEFNAKTQRHKGYDGREGIYPVEPERCDGVFLKLLDSRNSNAVTINPDFGCGEWSGPPSAVLSTLRSSRPRQWHDRRAATEDGLRRTGGIDLCADTMPQALTGSAAEGERPSPLALRDDAEKNR